MVRGIFRSLWKAISSLYGEFLQLVCFKIGKGDKVRLWEDKWAGKQTLKEQFPSLFRISTISSRPISEFVDQERLVSDESTSWNIHFSRNLLDREINQLQALLQTLEGRHLCNTVEDSRIWLADSSGLFSCKTVFAWLRNNNSLPVNNQAKCIWNLKIPIKVKVFIWLLILGKLSVHSQLQRRRPYHSLSPGWFV